MLTFPLYARLLGTGTRRGVVSMMLGMATFVINDTLTKLASATTPIGQLISIRNIMATVLLLVLVFATGQAAQLRRAAHPAILTRSSMDVIATTLFLTALAHMPIGNLTAINMSSPLLMTAVVAIFLQVPVGWRRWSAIAAGFAGIMLIVQPRAEGFNAYAVLALVVTVFVVARDISTRRIPQDISSQIIALTNAVMVLLAALALAAFQGWATIGLREYLLLGSAGIFLIIGYLLIVDAFRHGDIATVGPFRYTGLIWALLSGFLIWGEIPNTLAWGGIVIVVASGLYVLHREQVKARDEATKTVPVE